MIPAPGDALARNAFPSGPSFIRHRTQQDLDLAPTLTIGSRGSQLALVQSNFVRRLLRQQFSSLRIEVEVIKTRGDSTKGSLRDTGARGVFTGEIETALLDARIDLAVHSLKDLPTRFHDDLTLVATPVREDVRDVLVSREDRDLAGLPEGALIGTGSLRRQAQLLSLRPDLRFTCIRGNIDTRMRNTREGGCDAVVLAAAGLHRLEQHSEISAYLETREMLPAAGQAALGLQMKRDHPLLSWVESVNHPPTFAAVAAERSLLKHLGGGCRAPIAAWARQAGNSILLEGLVARPDGTDLVRATSSTGPEAAHRLGAEVASKLRGLGADAILQDPAVRFP